MTEENDSNGAPGERPPQRTLVDVIYSKLPLVETQGSLLVSQLLLRELIAALLQFGVLNGQQLTAMLDRISADVDERCKVEEGAARTPEEAQFMTEMMDKFGGSAKKTIDKARQLLTEGSSPHADAPTPEDL